MGKAFNNDIFGNTDITASINGLNISQESIDENKKAFWTGIISYHFYISCIISVRF